MISPFSARTLPAWAVALSIIVATPARADEWSFRVTPYLWLPSLDTTLAIDAAPPASDSTSILDILDGAVLVSAEARRGEFALIGEFNYLDLGDELAGPGGRTQVDIGLDGIMTSLAGAWSITSTDTTRIEALVGLRYWKLDSSIRFARLPGVSRRVSWVDPLAGIRGSIFLAESVSLQVLGNVGGFGAGSDLQWEALGRVTWRINSTFGAAAGYRHLDLDFNDEGLVLDMAMSGPFIAIDVNF